MGIKIENVKKSFGKKIVLNGISMEIPLNKITAIMGPSGVGKSTLLHILLGLVSADEGKISGCTGKKSAVFQEDRLCMNLSGVANIKLVNEKLSVKEIEKDMERIGLNQCFHQPVKELSGGMRRRISILRALLSEYDILLTDEPFQGLDEDTKDKVINYMKEKTENKTVIMVTHDRKEAEKLNAEIIYLEV